MDTTTSTSPATLQAQEFRLADISIYPAGEKQALVHARETGAACFLHTTYVDLLKGCRTFQSLDAHLAAFCQSRQLDERVRQGLCHKLAHLARDGYLVSRDQVRALFQRADESPTTPQITTLGIPTCNRVHALQRGLTCSIEHSQRCGRTLDVAVLDDSPALDTREAYRAVLRALQARYGVNIAYAGLDEKRAFARALSAAGGIPEEVISWACIGSREYDVGTFGANRNALLLHTTGECIFSSDDDVLCRVATIPEAQTHLAVSGQANLQIQFYPDRQSALDATRPVDLDIFALHEQWLGEHPCQGKAPYVRNGQIDVERAEPELLRRLVRTSGKVLVTVHGIAGDISCQSADILLFSEPLICAEETYRTAHASREITQCARQITLTWDSLSLTGMCIGGLDNRELLPPFSPVGRCEDACFGHLLAKCFAHASIVYLPWMLLHAPLETRQFTEPLFHLSIENFLIGCVGLFEPHPLIQMTPGELLGQLGQFLEHVGQLSASSLEAFARHIHRQCLGTRVDTLETWLHRYGERCAASWKRDAEAYCVQARRSMLAPVSDYLPAGFEAVQRATRQFAQVLLWWPSMVETARHLRAQGCRLAQPVA